MQHGEVPLSRSWGELAGDAARRAAPPSNRRAVRDEQVEQFHDGEHRAAEHQADVAADI